MGARGQSVSAAGKATVVGPTNPFVFENSQMHRGEDPPDRTVCEASGVVVGLWLHDEELYGRRPFDGFE